MPTVPASPVRAAAALRNAATTLKAAAAVSAAAILSRAQSDLEANAEAALGHFDDLLRQVQLLRATILRDALAPSDSDTVEVEIDDLDAAIDQLDASVDHARAMLFSVTSSAERDGLQGFVESLGELGRALQGVGATIAAPATGEAPFQFDQFFLQAMQDLSQRDWSADP